MKQTKCKLKQTDEIMDQKIESMEESIKIYEIPVGSSNDVIVTYGTVINIPELGLSLRTGEYMTYYEEEQEHMCDFALTLIYSENETEPDKYLYWEQDGYVIALYNYLCSIGKRIEMDSLEKVDCIVQFEVEE